MLVFGYYKEFIFVLCQKKCLLFYKDNSVNRYISHMVDQRCMLMKLDVFSNFKFNFNCTNALFYKGRINSDGVYVIKKKTRE